MDNKFLLYPLKAASPTITPESIRVITDFVEKTTGRTHSLTQLSPSVDWSDKSLTVRSLFTAHAVTTCSQGGGYQP